MNILVTGGAGFIGVNLIKYLLKGTEWKINVLDNLSTGKKDHLSAIDNYTPERVTFLKGDIRNKKDAENAARDCDYIVNLAAQTDVMESIDNPLNDAKINILGTINVLNAAVKEGCRRVVHASSAAPLGEQEPPVHEQKVPCPLSPYGASKLACEGYCSTYAGSYNLNTVALRFSNVYGPYSYHKGSVVALWIKQLLRDERPVIYGDGNQTRDFIHAKDIATAIYLSLTTELPSTYELFQIATGEETIINALYRIIREELEKKNYTVPEPQYKEERAGEIYRNYADISKAKKLLGYTPSISLKDGTRETVGWFVKEKIRV
ncbi:MAG: GDP-mannose 4,6-dehydratase [Euryarchaeota archaeon]|nr:GDP-mannose 4,6-dehydratase [Euryarchaeota archaeon]